MDGLHTQDSGQGLGRNLLIAMHQDNERQFVFILHDEGLDDPMFGNPQFPCRHAGSAVFFILVGSGDEIDLIFFQH